MRDHWFLFLRFLQFGLLAWGGPVAQIGMLRKELVDKEGWISSEKFNRVLAVYQALPGPEAHELCVYMGMVKAGRIGAILAGLGFMLPGVLLMTLLGWCYQTIGPAVLLPLFIGVKPAVVALIFRALHRIGKHALSNGWLVLCAVVAFGLTVMQVHFLLVLILCGITHLLWGRQWKLAAIALLVVSLGLATADYLAVRDTPVPEETGQAASPLFVEGLKAGMLSFGGAYTAIPFVEEGMVGKAANITPDVFIDAIAFVNMVPAPLVSFVTFLGYMAGGVAGAVLITIGVFLPAFSFTLFGHRYLEKVVEYQPLHGFLDGITAGVVGILAVTAIELAVTTVIDMQSAIIFAGALAALFLFKSRWAIPAIIVTAGIAGLLI